MVAPAMLTPWYAAWMIAFCSAWRHRQVSSADPGAAPDRQRSQPPSPQLGSPRGVSLYPVLSTIRSLTITAPTWRRRQVDRVAARRARFMKYSSHEGRATRSSAGPVQPVPRVPQSGQDVPVIVEPFVHRGGVDVHVRMLRMQAPDPLGSGDQHHQRDRAGAPLLEQVDRFDGRT